MVAGAVAPDGRRFAVGRNDQTARSFSTAGSEADYRDKFVGPGRLQPAGLSAIEFGVVAASVYRLAVETCGFAASISRAKPIQLLTPAGKPVRNDSLMRNVVRVVVAKSSNVIGAGFPSRTTAQTSRNSCACPLSWAASLNFFSRPL